MTYLESVATAPPSAAAFAQADLDRQPSEIRTALLAGVPAAERRLFEQGHAAGTGRVLRPASGPSSTTCFPAAGTS